MFSRVLHVQLCVALCILSVFLCGSSEADTSRKGIAISIPDPGLEAAIRDELDLPEGDILDSDMANLRYLDAYYRDITDLSGLEYATNLWALDLEGNQLTNISVLAQLTGLVDLILWNNQISDISPLSGLTNLVNLELGYNPISDISPLANLTNLWELNLWENSIADISALASLTNLVWLEIGYNPIVNIAALASLTQLNELDLEGIAASDFSPLSQLINLEYLSLWDNGLTNISFLSPLTSLRELELDNNYVSDVTPLAQMTGLERLYLGNNEIAEVTPLRQMENLKWLYLYANPLSVNALCTDIPAMAVQVRVFTDSQCDGGVVGEFGDVVVFEDINLEWAVRDRLGKPDGNIFQSEMESITYLNACCRNITSLSGLEYAVNLFELELEYNQITDLEPLRGLTQLLGLELSGNMISNIEPLTAMTNLDWLDLEENQISSVSALVGMTQLTDLILCDNFIVDIAALASLTNLYVLELCDNELSNIDALAGLVNLHWLSLEENFIASISPLASLTQLRGADLSSNYFEDISALTGITTLEWLIVYNNSLSEQALCTDIPGIEERGRVLYEGVCGAEGEGEGEEEGEGEGEPTCVNATVDSDGDGLSDCYESELGLQANNPDSDGDGMPDGYEVNNNLLPNVNDADLDLDGDGLSNLTEFLRGSNPDNPIDPNLIYYVAPDGVDEVGAGTSANSPWQTITFALSQLTASTATTLLVAPGDYTEDITLRSFLTLRGSADGTTRLLGTVIGGDNSTLENVTLFSDGRIGRTLLTIENVPMVVRNVEFTGASATGILTSGTLSADTVIEQCTFTDMHRGINVEGSLPVIRRCIFESLTGDGIIISQTNRKQTGGNSLGDTTDPNSGYNTFDLSSIEGLGVLNNSGTEILMQNNDWGTEDTAVIAENVQGADPDLSPLPAGAGILASALYCTVWDRETQLPVLDAEVSLLGTTLAPVTDNVDGVYAFPAIAGGSFQLMIAAPGYEDENLTVIVETSSTKSVVAPLDTSPVSVGCYGGAAGPAQEISWTEILLFLALVTAFTRCGKRPYAGCSP
jgi:internalin A